MVSESARIDVGRVTDVAKSSKNKTNKTAAEKAKANIVEDVVEATVEVEVVEEVVEERLEDSGETSDLEMEIVDDTIAPEVEEVAQPVSAPVPQSSNAGFLPLLLGGVAAGAIGYGIATYFPMNVGEDYSAQIAAQADQIAALEAQLADVAVVPDLSGVEAQIAEVSNDVAAQVEGLSASIGEQIAGLDDRLLEVEKRPSGDGTLSDTALAAYQRELEELRADLDAQQENVMSAAAQAEADLAAARAEAERLEQDALAQAEAAAARAALNRVAAAVETGAPFGDALADLNEGDVSAALMDAAETGVATTAQLTADFSAAARAALATARAEGLTDDASGVGGFLRSQFDVRSTTPQEGPGPDAVLSRAEAAAKEGRIADALAELEALPEVARAEITDWTARAQQRADVLDAIATLSETYN